MIDVKVTGLAELNATLRALPEALRARALKGMCATGAAVIKDEAKRRAPVWTGSVQEGHPPPGTLKRAIYQTRLVQECTSTREVWMVNVRKGKQFRAVGKGAINLDAYYASWVEYGHYTRAPMSAGTTPAKRMAAHLTGSVTSVRLIPAHPYMRPAFETKKQDAVRAMGTYLAYSLADVASLAKKSKV